MCSYQDPLMKVSQDPGFLTGTAYPFCLSMYYDDGDGDGIVRCEKTSIPNTFHFVLQVTLYTPNTMVLIMRSTLTPHKPNVVHFAGCVHQGSRLLL